MDWEREWQGESQAFTAISSEAQKESELEIRGESIRGEGKTKRIG